MKVFRVKGESGEIIFQERVPDSTPIIYMEWSNLKYNKISKIEIIEVNEELKK